MHLTRRGWRPRRTARADPRPAGSLAAVGYGVARFGGTGIRPALLPLRALVLFWPAGPPMAPSTTASARARRAQSAAPAGLETGARDAHDPSATPAAALGGGGRRDA